MRPTITVITPCYNQAQYLEECVQSVLDQTFKDWKMIIVNDCSPDNTEEVAKKLSQKDSRISYISHAKNLGLSAARNTGIFAAKTPYILPLDADDKLHPRCLEKLLEAIEDDFGDIIYSDFEYFGEKGGLVEMPEYCFDRLKVMNLCVCTCLYKKEDALSIGGYDENMRDGYEDWDFMYRMGKAGFQGYRVARPLFYYRIKKKSMIAETRKKHNQILKYMFSK